MNYPVDKAIHLLNNWDEVSEKDVSNNDDDYLFKPTLVLRTRILVVKPGGKSTPKSSMLGYDSF